MPAAPHAPGTAAEAGGSHLQPVEVLERSGDPAAVDDLIELEAQGYKGREGIALRSFLGKRNGSRRCALASPPKGAWCSRA